ncbi:beta strand repeat-containing protein [Duganella qianjiadongensis]|uniref:PEP-CTERM sorting domain-containing protein n=1 Tax=Duganella qianjiadongensis TaxID=2692176 RepID=A0ABW9VSD7_9BURK|nr:FxDxF family PEP-CTERM protein [Duganella qianjiadongensis]MYM42097.1 PEP-CTERM sorting domain-containing protein [Duganella qianjiadongensis]
MSLTLSKISSAIQILALSAPAPLVVTAAAFPGTINTAITVAQTLDKNQAGTVSSAGSLTVAGSSVAVTVTGNGATLNNQGVIFQSGTGRIVRDNTGVSNLLITNGGDKNSTALMKAADADVIQMNKANASVTLNNYGSMLSLNASAAGNQVIDFNAIASGSNVVNNFAGGVMTAYEADAVRPGVNGVVNNNGLITSITTTGSSSDAIDGQNNSGIVIVNGLTGVITGGRHGITGGQKDASQDYTISINNEAGGLISANNGAGINIDGYNGRQVATIVNRGSIIGNGVKGDGDGVDVDGLANITNSGLIRSINAYSATELAFSEGISIGGGTVSNSGTIEGLVAAGNTNAVGRGITLAGNDIAGKPGSREGLYGNAVISNQKGGLIYGQSDSAIVAVGAASGYTVSISNAAGAVIRGGGSSSAAIKTGADNTVLVNAGSIDGSSSGKAIEFGNAKNTLTVNGGSITGDINGGGGQNTMLFSVGAGNAFAYSGSISNFNHVEVQSGVVTLSGESTYAGSTVLSGGTLQLVGAGRLSSASALQLNGGSLQLLQAGGQGQTFASLSLTDNSAVLLGASSLTFNGLGAVVSGKTLTFTEAASGAYAFRLLGDVTHDASFLQLVNGTSINGLAVRYQFDGKYTDVAAVPEPASYGMLLGGLGLMALVARRRKTAR